MDTTDGAVNSASGLTVEVLIEAVKRQERPHNAEAKKTILLGLKKIDAQNRLIGRSTKYEETCRKMFNQKFRSKKLEQGGNMNASIIFDGKNGFPNYCSCDNCKGGSPVLLPALGTRLYSTERIKRGGHFGPDTLFLSADRCHAAWVSGAYDPFIPGLSASPRRVFQKTGFKRLGMIESGFNEYMREPEWAENKKSVAWALSAYAPADEIEARMLQFKLPEDYIWEVMEEIKKIKTPPSGEEVMAAYHCYGDIFLRGSEDEGEEPSFLFGWERGYGNPTEDKRHPDEKCWDEILQSIEKKELPEPIFNNRLDTTSPFKEIIWGDQRWIKLYECCPGKYNFVSTGGKYRPISGWEEVKK